MFKKAQVETMGLVVIIILVIFIALFFLKYSGENKKEEDAFLSIKANNYLNALKLVTVGNTNFGALAMECCSFGTSCNMVYQMAEASLGFLDESASFELRCVDGTTHSAPLISPCDYYVASGSMIFISGDEMSARICRK